MVMEEMAFNRIARTAAAFPELIDLACGYPTPGPPDWLWEFFIEQLSQTAMNDTDEPYGMLDLRTAVAEEFLAITDAQFDPVNEITITGSASEAITAAILATVPKGASVIIFSPHFPIYATATRIAGGVARFVEIDYSGVNIEQVERQFDDTTAAIIVNTPHNPTGRVFKANELERIATLCEKHQAVMISDEVFGHMVYHGEYMSAGKISGIRNMSILISDSGKKLDLKGFKLGYMIADTTFTERLRVIQQTVTYRMPVALQRTIAFGLRHMNSDYFAGLHRRFLANANQLSAALSLALQGRGSLLPCPEAGPFLLADISSAGEDEALEFLASRGGVLTLPGSAFFDGNDREERSKFLRISFARTESIVQEAVIRLRRAAGSDRQE